MTEPGFWKWRELHPRSELSPGASDGTGSHLVRGTGYCIDALEAALWAVSGAADFRSAVLRAANLGDDADTTAAIAGQLAGARWDASAIPGAWRERIALAARIVSFGHGLYVAEGGTDDGSWPFDDLLHAWWVRPGQLLAGEYPGHLAGGRCEEKINVLLDAGIRTIVDLTTPADGLDPYATALGQAGKSRRLDVRRIGFPIPDLGVVDDDFYG